MLKCVSRYAVLIVFSLLMACGQKKEEDNRVRSSKILEISKKAIGEEEYNKLYQQVSDSLNTWCSEKLPGYESIWSFSYRVDSVLCFNREKDRMVTAILGKHDRSDCEADAVDYFYGAKIKDQWYFFRGGTMVIIREHYQKDIHTPVSFAKLHELAMNNMLRGYIKKNRDGEWEVNDAFFTHHFENVGWGDFEMYQDTVVYGKRFASKKEYFDSIYLRKSNSKWLKKEK